MYVLLSMINKFVRIEWASLYFVFILIFVIKVFLPILKKNQKNCFLKIVWYLYVDSIFSFIHTYVKM